MDLSAQGLRLSLSGNRRAFLKPRDLLPLCEFRIHSGLRIRCRARVCAYRLSQKPWRQTQLSLQLVDLDPNKHKLLARFIQQQLARARQAA